MAQRHGINPKTIAKWKNRTAVGDLPTGPKEVKATILTIEEEAIISDSDLTEQADHCGKAIAQPPGR